MADAPAKLNTYPCRICNARVADFYFGACRDCAKVAIDKAAAKPAPDWAGCCRASRHIWGLVNAMYSHGDPRALAMAPTATCAEIIAGELGIATPCPRCGQPDDCHLQDGTCPTNITPEN